jgi:hypothetical protein
LDLFRILMGVPIFQSVLRPVLRPLSRLALGLIAIPLFRFLLRRIFRVQELDQELEKDLQEWFRASLLLLAATANMEHVLFGWLTRVDWLDRADWLTMGLRLLMVIGVIQTMPDQELFAVLHPGPPKFEKGQNLIAQLREKRWLLIKGHLCRHMNRSSPVLAMMCAIVGAQMPRMPEESVAVIYQKQVLLHQSVISWACSQTFGTVTPVRAAASVLIEDRTRINLTELNRAFVESNSAVSQNYAELGIYLYRDSQYRRDRERWAVGWVCYLMAIIQYLIIGLVTSRDKAMNVLSEFDRAVEVRRRELIEEFHLGDRTTGRTAEPLMPSADAPTEKPKSGPAKHEDDAPAPEPGPGPGPGPGGRSST